MTQACLGPPDPVESSITRSELRQELQRELRAFGEDLQDEFRHLGSSLKTDLSDALRHILEDSAFKPIGIGKHASENGTQNGNGHCTGVALHQVAPQWAACLANSAVPCSGQSCEEAEDVPWATVQPPSDTLPQDRLMSLATQFQRTGFEEDTWKEDRLMLGWMTRSRRKYERKRKYPGQDEGEDDDDIERMPNVEALHGTPRKDAGDEDDQVRQTSKGTSLGSPTRVERNPNKKPSRTSLNSQQSYIPQEAPWWQRRLRIIVTSPAFDYVSILLIVANAVSLGVQTDHQARYKWRDPPSDFRRAETFFCIFFTGELLIKLAAYRCSFFINDMYRWNIFDCIVVGMQLSEEFMALLAPAGDGSEGGGGTNLSAMRMLRILRLVRIIRLVRVMRLVGELRSIIVSIFSSMQSLIWTLVLLLLIMYIVAVYLTQLVSDYLVDAQRNEVQEELEKYFGTLGQSIVSLYQAITGGVDWSQLLFPLQTHVSNMSWVVICGYIGFVIFTLMNVVTGVFVESSLRSVDKDKELFLMHHAKDLFKNVDDDGSGDVTLKEFSEMLHTPAMQMYFQAVDLNLEDATDLFRLIDLDNSGTLDAAEFVHGCLRLRGAAKAIDIATMMHEYKRMTTKFAKHAQHVDCLLDQLRQLVVTCMATSRTTIVAQASPLPTVQNLCGLAAADVKPELKTPRCSSPENCRLLSQAGLAEQNGAPQHPEQTVSTAIPGETDDATDTPNTGAAASTADKLPLLSAIDAATEEVQELEAEVQLERQRDDAAPLALPVRAESQALKKPGDTQAQHRGRSAATED
eukprot:TRINITY_DN46991_c0_g1_i1.p1 TRINITY_DN46991_c0_g1~~TRINITY_DN46991_c0_g1_i1.p1  ORF type:complete len:801 (+),score=182.89 TRINITY_DN46991_c0_g1_i1:65-2467(+)